MAFSDKDIRINEHARYHAERLPVVPDILRPGNSPPLPPELQAEVQERFDGDERGAAVRTCFFKDFFWDREERGESRAPVIKKEYLPGYPPPTTTSAARVSTGIDIIAPESEVVKNVSNATDENGEPLVGYHQSSGEGFYVFETLNSLNGFGTHSGTKEAVAIKIPMYTKTEIYLLYISETKDHTFQTGIHLANRYHYMSIFKNAQKNPTTVQKRQLYCV